MPVDEKEARIFMIVYFDFRKENPRFFYQYKHRLMKELALEPRQHNQRWGPYSFLSHGKPSQWTPKDEVSLTEEGDLSYNGVVVGKKSWMEQIYKFRRDYSFMEFRLGLKLVKE